MFPWKTLLNSAVFFLGLWKATDRQAGNKVDGAAGMLSTGMRSNLFDSGPQMASLWKQTIYC